MAKIVHDATQRVRLLRSQYEIGRISLGVEGAVYADALAMLGEELIGFADEIQTARIEEER